MAMEKIPAGGLLTVSTGEYSDYIVQGVFRALEAIDADALRDEWLHDHPEQAAPYRFDAPQFLGWVVGKGLLEQLDAFEWHLGGYSCAADMEVHKPATP